MDEQKRIVEQNTREAIDKIKSVGKAGTILHQESETTFNIFGSGEINIYKNAVTKLKAEIGYLKKIVDTKETYITTLKQYNDNLIADYKDIISVKDEVIAMLRTELEKIASD